MKIVNRDEFKKYLFPIVIFSICILVWMNARDNSNEIEPNTSSQSLKGSISLEKSMEENKLKDEKQNYSSKAYVDPFRDRLILQNSNELNPSESVSDARNIVIDPFKEKLKQQANDAKLVTVSPFGEINKLMNK